MQAAEAIKQRNKLGRRVQVLAVVSYVLTGGLMFLSHTKSVEWLQDEIPTTAEQLKEVCRGTKKVLRQSQSRIVRPVCEDIDFKCWHETKDKAAGAYEACFLRESEAVFDDDQNRIVDKAQKTWHNLRIFICGTCALSTLVQWYCGVFAATLARNKGLVGCFILFNAIFAGYWFRTMIEGRFEFMFLLPPVLSHLASAYYATFLLMKQAQVSALPTHGLLSGADVPQITVSVVSSVAPGVSGASVGGGSIGVREM